MRSSQFRRAQWSDAITTCGDLRMTTSNGKHAVDRLVDIERVIGELATGIRTRRGHAVTMEVVRSTLTLHLLVSLSASSSSKSNNLSFDA
jgi:hypothetical protein